MHTYLHARVRIDPDIQERRLPAYDNRNAVVLEYKLEYKFSRDSRKLRRPTEKKSYLVGSFLETDNWCTGHERRQVSFYYTHQQGLLLTQVAGGWRLKSRLYACKCG